MSSSKANTPSAAGDADRSPDARAAKRSRADVDADRSPVAPASSATACCLDAAKYVAMRDSLAVYLQACDDAGESYEDGLEPLVENLRAIMQAKDADRVAQLRVDTLKGYDCEEEEESGDEASRGAAAPAAAAAATEGGEGDDGAAWKPSARFEKFFARALKYNA